jgi:hypothetical protein
MRTPDYIQIVGLIKQGQIYLAPNDTGGEMDPHGADQRGNPLGGLVFSKSFNTTNYVQVVEWHKYVANPTHLHLVLTPNSIASWAVVSSV